MNRQTWWPQFRSCVEQLSLERLSALGDYYAADAVFQDPFHTLTGRPAILGGYAAMFKGLHQPRFESLSMAVQEQTGAIAVRWVFRFSVHSRAPKVEIPGTSWLTLNDQGEITRHEDHWDASRLLEAFPVVGGLNRWVKKRIAKLAQSR